MAGLDQDVSEGSAHVPTQQGRHRMNPVEPSALRVTYRHEAVTTLLDPPGTLAVFGFADAATDPDDARYLRVVQSALDPAAPSECWLTDAMVSHGREGDLRWSRGGGWQFVAIEVDECGPDDIEAACTHAYDRLLAHVAASPEHHLLRIWNYLEAINAGAGDSERYRRFCDARARSMAAHGLTRFPAATAIGHRGPQRRLQVYALCGQHDGTALENPRQVSAWAYPRQYGPTAPSFARAMLLPRGGLAISGTAAVIGHASSHAGNVTAQAGEAIANLRALLERASLPPFDGSSPLKVYVRHPEDAEAVRGVLDRQLGPSVPRLLLQGDICRSELLVEIDGWRFAA
jgi:chorismate lyase/3-hydroxybenzoate synthase